MFGMYKKERNINHHYKKVDIVKVFICRIETHTVRCRDAHIDILDPANFLKFCFQRKWWIINVLTTKMRTKNSLRVQKLSFLSLFRSQLVRTVLYSYRLITWLTWLLLCFKSFFFFKLMEGFLFDLQYYLLCIFFSFF